MFLLFLLFHASMLAGLSMLAAFWMSGSDRHLPNRVSMPLLLGLPFAGWLLGTVVGGPLILIVPVSLGAAFAFSYRSVRAGRSAVRARRAETLLSAERQISEDPSNAGAYIARAELLEEDGRFAEARSDYQRAFGASDRALTRHALSEHLERLDHAEKAAAAREALAGSFLARAVRGGRVETALLAVAAAAALASPAHGAALASTALMLLWCRRLRRGGGSA